MADPIQLSREIPAPPNVVFNYWIEPRRMKQWLFKSATNEIRDVINEPRVGGRFSILAWSEGERIDHYGVYEEIQRPHLLEFSLQVPKHFSGVTRVKVAIAPTAGGSMLTFTQTGVPREVTEAPWRAMLETLARVAAG